MTRKLVAICCSMALGLTVQVGMCSETPKLQYNRHVRPILSDNCFACHGPDENSRESGLRLDQRESAVAELDSGVRAIVPGDLTLQPSVGTG